MFLTSPFFDPPSLYGSLRTQKKRTFPGRKFLGMGLSLLVLTLLPSCSEALPENRLEKDGRYSSFSLADGTMKLYTNKWGSDHEKMDLTIWGADTGDEETIDFPVGWDWKSDGGFVTSYPHIGVGLSPWSTESTHKKFPVRLDKLKKLKVTYDLEINSSNKNSLNYHNIAFDLWIASTDGPTEGKYVDHRLYEIMIWLARGSTVKSGIQPIRNSGWEEEQNPEDYNYTAGGSALLTNPLGSSQTFRLFKGYNTSWNVLSLLSFDFLGDKATDNQRFWWGLITDTNGRYSGTLDIKDILEWMQAKDLIVENGNSLLLLDVEFGMEIGQGKGSFSVEDFNLSIQIED